jgi:hypothetical protein
VGHLIQMRHDGSCKRSGVAGYSSWNVTDRASFSKVRDFCEGIVAEDEKQFQHGGTFGILVREAIRELVDQIKRKAVGKCTDIDVLA